MTGHVEDLKINKFTDEKTMLGATETAGCLMSGYYGSLTMVNFAARSKGIPGKTWKCKDFPESQAPEQLDPSPRKRLLGKFRHKEMRWL